MKILMTRAAVRDYKGLTPRIRKSVAKQLDLLVGNLNHPSLKAKKYDEANDVWQARVTRSYRFHFKIEGDTYAILRIMEHPK